MMLRQVVRACCVFAIIGCGSKGYQLASVSGKVTLDGDPLVGAHVTFVPLGSPGKIDPGPGSHGMTDSEGRFTLRTSAGASGAVVGMHRVAIEAAQEGESGEQSDGAESEEALKRRMATLTKVPPKYNRDTDLTFDVSAGGSKAADFTLSSR